jgi:hypothetical protein
MILCISPSPFSDFDLFIVGAALRGIACQLISIVPAPARGARKFDMIIAMPVTLPVRARRR